MALFVHITDARLESQIRRNGLKAIKYGRDGFEKAVFCLPVTQDYTTSHQWLRELKRRGIRTMIAVYFKLPDGETVLYGKYHSAHRKRTASEALAHYLAEENK